MGCGLLAEAARGRQFQEVDIFTSVARCCLRHRRWVLAAWVLLFVAGIVIGSQVFSRLKDSNGGSGSESVQGASIVARAAAVGQSAVVLVKAHRWLPRAPARRCKR
jgi:hypothetical protein